MKFKGLRFKGVVKEQFHMQFKPIAAYGQWEYAVDSVIRSFADNDRAYYIPCGVINNMPDSWNKWETNNCAIDNSYDVNTGYWTFQCSVPYVRNTIERFLELVPYFADSVEYCEVYQEDWVSSHKYELVDNTMKLTDESFVVYKSERLSNRIVFRKSKSYVCTLCNCKDAAKLQEISLKRTDNSIAFSFDVCDGCLKQLRQDIGLYLG